MVDIVQQVSTDIVLSDKSEAEAGTNNTKFMTPLRTKEAIDKNTSSLLPNTSIVQVEGNATDKVMSQVATTASIATAKTELTNQIGAAVLPFNAMSQSQFEAIRAANNEEFAASGFIHFGKHRSGAAGTVPVNNGLFSKPQEASVLGLGFLSTSSGVAGSSKSDLPVLNVAGVTYNIAGINHASGSESVIKFPSAPDGKTTYNKSTGAIVTHADSTTAFAAQAADPTNVEVVIDRVDMWGFESWLEEVNSTNPFIYPNGLIQSQAATMDGITTSASARPVTYYAVFDGDTDSKGKGVNFLTLTDAQKKKVLGNHKNNLHYLDDGRLVQWRLRQRTIAGAGNGDWGGIEASNLGQTMACYQPHVACINPQGKINSITKPLVSTADVNSGGFSGRLNQMVTVNDYAVLKVTDTDAAGTASVNGECYFLVCGTVNRLNQGAYHPSFNSSGTRLASGGNAWSSPAGISALTSTVTCFENAYVASGNISSAYSGRPSGENQYYDAIYASGFGGVCRDMRYSANGLTPTDFADADQRVKNGTYRGFEKAVFSTVEPNTTVWYDAAANTIGITGNVIDPSIAGSLPLGTRVHFVTNAGVVSSGVVSANTINTLVRLIGTSAMANGNNTGFLIVENPTRYASIGGSFLQTDIIGSPERILATPQLANGWQGSWIPVIPDGTSKDFPYTRKKIAETVRKGYAIWTTNNGASWSTGTATSSGSDVKNTFASVGFSDTSIYLIPYQAFAKQTKPSVNAVVYSGQSGVGDVFAVTDHYKTAGGLLAESATGLILKNNTGISQNTKSLLTKSVDNSGKPTSSATTDGITYSALTLATPANASAGFKCVNYPTVLNQQGFINYAYTELKHNGTNWGDDSKVTIVNNQSTKTDLNGNTVLAGTAQTCESLGWIKNKL